MSVTSRPVHLGYLDGVRGWLALYVALGHIWQFATSGPDYRPLPRWFEVMTPLKFGSYAVAVFIVLSGYCLMLPVAPAPSATLRGGVSGFLARRCKRILPPYYAALAIAIALACTRWLGRPTVTQWDISLPSLTLGSIAAHLALVHNLWASLEWKLNPPMWTVALEWQIYFVFALILLPLYRRVGPWVTVLAAFGLGLLAVCFGAGFAATWLLGDFALGMVAAVANFGPQEGPARAVRGSTWRRIGIALVLAIPVLMVTHHHAPVPPFVADTVVGVAATACFVTGTGSLQEGQPLPRPMRLFAKPLSIALGQFSYSLYLTHYPIVALVYEFVRSRNLPPATTFFVVAALGVPVVLLFAYVFHRLFERPFMTPVRTREPSAVALVGIQGRT